MNIHQATRQYEQWLTGYMPLVQADIDLKHRQMATGLFPFLRATFYRWAQAWPVVCPEAAHAPIVLGVGDLHIENFGTWRDAEGRLVWGVNDFDEAYPLPYTNDLLRLATGALMVIAVGHLQLDAEEACNALLAGYTEGIQSGGQGFVLAERHGWLRDIAISSLKKPEPYWQKMDALPAITEVLPESARTALEHALPAVGMAYQVRHRIAGMGSLGRPRYVAVGEFKDGRVAREAKALAPSATVWATNHTGPVEYFYQAILDQAVRSHDPFVQLQGQWIVRRLAPDCSRIELNDLPDVDSEVKLMRAMGKETANVHAGSKQAISAVQQDLARRPKGWLLTAARLMLAAIQSDLNDWNSLPT